MVGRTQTRTGRIAHVLQTHSKPVSKVVPATCGRHGSSSLCPQQMDQFDRPMTKSTAAQKERCSLNPGKPRGAPARQNQFRMEDTHTLSVLFFSTDCSSVLNASRGEWTRRSIHLHRPDEVTHASDWTSGSIRVNQAVAVASLRASE